MQPPLLPLPIETITALRTEFERVFRVIDQHQLQFGLVASADMRNAMPQMNQAISMQTRLNPIGTAAVAALKLMHSFDLSITQLSQALDISFTRQLVESTSVISSAWRTHLEPLKMIHDDIQRHHRAMQTHLAGVARLSIISQDALLGFPWERMGNAVGVNQQMRSALNTQSLQMAESYSGVYEAFRQRPALAWEAAPYLSRAPTIEFFNHVSLQQAVTVPDSIVPTLATEQRESQAELRQETQPRLEHLLKRLNGDLLVPLQGARRSLVED